MKDKYPINTFSGETQKEIIALFEAELKALEKECVKNNFIVDFDDDEFNHKCVFLDDIIKAFAKRGIK